MELIERDGFLAALQAKFEQISTTGGHCIFLNGESGMGKTSLVRTFCEEKKNDSKIYLGTCDALFTPRPLAPLYDIALQIRKDFLQNSGDMTDRAGLFTRFFQEFADKEEPTLIVIEDIHWADEATFDFIKYLARRIKSLHCLFILTYRDDEIHTRHPIRNLMGQLPADFFTRMQLTPLSRQAVEKMALERGYSGEDVYGISGGNPFYVSEILASYSPGIPDNIRDSILSVFNLVDERTRHIWEVLSVMPTGIEIKNLEKIEPSYSDALKNCFDSKILVARDSLIVFKHELYRRTIEASLSPLLRVALNKKVLDLFLENYERQGLTERIVHHAKNANDYDLVVRYAPQAAAEAAALGAHIEASKLYFTAIEYYQGKDEDRLIQFYEAYAYECFLTNQVKEAIIYQTRALNIWKTKCNAEKTGNCIRFLSRLWWYDGNHQQAESFAAQAVSLLEDQPSSSAKGMAFSNMSQLKMIASKTDECFFWSEKALAIARELDDRQVLTHVLTNIGTAKLWIPASSKEGMNLLKQGLDIAIKNNYPEHAARAYANLVAAGMDIKEYVFAENFIREGIQYCEEKNLDSLINCIISSKARLRLETGQWNEAFEIASRLIKNENLVPIAKIESLVVVAKIKMRKGEDGALPLLLEAMPIALNMQVLEYLIPVMCGLLEYEWITGKTAIDEKSIELMIGMVGRMGNIFKNSEFAFWLFKARKQKVPLDDFYPGYRILNQKMAGEAAAIWEKMGCSYEQALVLSEGSDTDKRKAISLVDGLGAKAIYEKMKMDMRASGMKSIPRGIRESTRSNPALLTGRELDVLQLLKEGMHNKEIAAKLFISAKTVDHHISALLFKLDVNSRVKAVREAKQLGIINREAKILNREDSSHQPGVFSSSSGSLFTTKRMDMKKFVVERNLPGAGNLSPEELQAISESSCVSAQQAGTPYYWIQSFITSDKIYCIHIAENEEAVRAHARSAKIPINTVSEVIMVIDPLTSNPKG